MRKDVLITCYKNGYKQVYFNWCFPLNSTASGWWVCQNQTGHNVLPRFFLGGWKQRGPVLEGAAPSQSISGGFIGHFYS